MIYKYNSVSSLKKILNVARTFYANKLCKYDEAQIWPNLENRFKITLSLIHNNPIFN